MPIVDVTWLCLCEIDGVRHVIKASSGPDEPTVRRHLQQTNKRMKILDLRPATIEEIEKAAADVRAAPNYVPITNADLNPAAPDDTTGPPPDAPGVAPVTFQ